MIIYFICELFTKHFTRVIFCIQSDQYPIQLIIFKNQFIVHTIFNSLGGVIDFIQSNVSIVFSSTTIIINLEIFIAYDPKTQLTSLSTKLII